MEGNPWHCQVHRVSELQSGAHVLLLVCVISSELYVIYYLASLKNQNVMS